MAKIDLGVHEGKPLIIDYDEEFSFKFFSNYSFALNEIDLSGKTIYSSVFSTEILDFEPFHKDMKDVTFVNCSLDNVVIPNGNTVIYNNGFYQKRFKVQNDGEDWVIDKDNKPIEPMNKKLFLRLGFSIDPKDIPIEPVKESILMDKLLKGSI